MADAGIVAAGVQRASPSWPKTTTTALSGPCTGRHQVFVKCKEALLKCYEQFFSDFLRTAQLLQHHKRGYEYDTKFPREKAGCGLVLTQFVDADVGNSQEGRVPEVGWHKGQADRPADQAGRAGRQQTTRAYCVLTNTRDVEVKLLQGGFQGLKVLGIFVIMAFSAY